MRTKTLLPVLLLLVCAGCGHNNPRQFYLAACHAVEASAATAEVVHKQCRVDPNSCPLGNDDWQIVRDTLLEAKGHLYDWEMALRDGNDYWTPAAAAAATISELQIYLKAKQ